MMLREVASVMFYHGTSRDFKPGEWIKPPDEHGLEISEKGRKKNLNKVFFTKDIGSAKIYAGRAKNSLGGKAMVYIIDPYGEIEELNPNKGTTVYMSPKAKVLKRMVI